MSTGDKIPCATLDEALKRMDESMKDGWDVDLVYAKDAGAVLTVKERAEE